MAYRIGNVHLPVTPKVYPDRLFLIGARSWSSRQPDWTAHRTLMFEHPLWRRKRSVEHSSKSEHRVDVVATPGLWSSFRDPVRPGGTPNTCAGSRRAHLR